MGDITYNEWAEIHEMADHIQVRGDDEPEDEFGNHLADCPLCTDTVIRALVALCDDHPEAGFANAVDMVRSWANAGDEDDETPRTGDDHLDAMIQAIVGYADPDDLIDMMDAPDDNFNE